MSLNSTPEACSIDSEFWMCAEGPLGLQIDAFTIFQRLSQGDPAEGSLAFRRVALFKAIRNSSFIILAA
jgi:hypothetical protein